MLSRRLTAFLGKPAMGLLFTAVLANPAAAAVQAPHRAVYDLSLVRSSHGSGVDGVTGRMVFEITGNACEGYSVNFRLVNRYVYREGNSRLVDVQSTTFEAGDAKRFDYQEREFIDNVASQEKRTVVERRSPDLEGDGEIRQPLPKTFRISAGALFPLQHQLMVVDAAVAGQKRFVAEVFDGSDDVNSVQAIATIGNRIAPGTGKDKDDAKAAPLQEFASWPITIAYFPTGSQSDTPTFQISFSLYENGVATNMTLDYGNLALAGRLTDLKMLEADECK